MLEKAWRWLIARPDGRPRGRVRFSVHRHPTFASSWGPILTPTGQPGMQVQIYLEASNMGTSACRIVAAEIAGMPTLQTVIGVRDARTHNFAPDNVLPPGHLTTVSLAFLLDGQLCSSGESLHVAVILTDHTGGEHRVNVIMH
jgi:hypothetical protein